MTKAYRLSDLQCLLVFLSSAIVSRVFSFFNTVLDHDESTYLVFAQQLSKGAQLYTDLIDLKPPMGLWLFQALYQIIGSSIPAFRFVLALMVGLTAYLLFKLVLQLKGSRQAGFLSGFLYILICLFHHALSFNMEHWMNIFTIAGFVLACSPHTVYRKILAGTLIGLAFCVKYLALFDMMALGLFMLITECLIDKKSIGKLFLNSLGLIVGFIIPFILVNTYFYYSPNWDAYYFITFEAPSNYRNTVGLDERLIQVLKFHVKYIAYFIAFYMVAFSKGPAVKIRYLGIIWLVCSLVSMQITGQFFGHYSIQSYLAIALLAGSIVDVDWLSQRFGRSVPLKTLVKLSFFSSVLVAVIYYFDYHQEEDPEKEVYEYLSNNFERENSVFPANGASVLYFLREQDPVIPYVHSSLIHYPKHIKTLEIDTISLWREIAISPSDIAIVKRGVTQSIQLNLFLEKHYALKKEFKSGYQVFSKKD